MSKYIHPITLEAAEEVASNLRPDDYRELTEGWGINPMQLAAIVQDGDSVWFEVPNCNNAGI